MSDCVRYDVDSDGICTLTMDIPDQSMNTLGSRLQPALRAAIDRAADDDAVTGILLVSGKPTFVAGGDLKEMDAGGASLGEDLPPEQQVDRAMTLSNDLRQLETCGKPVAVVVNGVAAGGGMEIVLACHYRVASDDRSVRLGLPEVQVGLMPGAGGTQRLPRMLGVTTALPLILTGELMPAAKAKELGIIQEVVPADRTHEVARRWLLEQGDPVAPWDKPGFVVPGGAGQMVPDIRNFLHASNAMTRATTFGNLPAPAAIMAAVHEGTQLPFDQALRLEAKYFVTLFSGPVARAMIRTLFVSKQDADKLVRRPQGPAKQHYDRLGILGAGTMGAGLALTAAKAGLSVVLLDVSQEQADRGRAYAQRRLDRDVEKGRSTPEKRDAVLARITATDDYAALSDVPVVIEAVFESREVKKAVIERLEEVLPDDAVVASNTSAMPITGLAEFSRRPERFIGMHFFSPAERMPLVEIIRGERTADETLARALDLAQAMRKTPIVVNDSPGFFTSRLIGSFIKESLRMIEEGVNPNLVDNAARMLGMPMGAMTISDAIGLDVGYQAAKQQAEDSGVPVDTSTLGISGRLVVEHGRHGLKSGQGFYDYGPDGSKRLWPGLAQMLPTLDLQPDVEEVKARILYAQLLEASRMFSEGVLTHAADGDLGAVLGVGFPPYLGGPFSAMDGIGLPEVVAEADRLHAAHGSPFEAPDLLRRMAEVGETFHGRTAVTVPTRHTTGV